MFVCVSPNLRTWGDRRTGDLLVPSRDPGGGTDPVWLRFLGSGTKTKLGPGPNYSLEPTFNDAEILHGVIEEHVACWYHHWMQGSA